MLQSQKIKCLVLSGYPRSDPQIELPPFRNCSGWFLIRMKKSSKYFYHKGFLKHYFE